MATVHDFIACPKCGQKKMKQAIPQKFGKEYYAHCCHIYFGVNELVNQWNYDAGDLFPYYPVTHANYKNMQPSHIGIEIDFMEQEIAIFSSVLKVGYSEWDGGEPMWATEQERVDAYQMVGRMFQSISEVDDYADARNTMECALQIGVQ